MKYKITHTTKYVYESPVRVCQNLVLQTPRDDDRVQTINHRMVIRPTPLIHNRRLDFYGNVVHAFSIEESHRQLTVTSTSRVRLRPREPVEAGDTPDWAYVLEKVRQQLDSHWLEASGFQFDSRRIRRSEDFAHYARISFQPKRPIVDAVLDLTDRIHRDFAYDPAATVVNTSTEEAFQLRRGVCQDFAHIQITCFRSLGLPARYVSGYLRTLPPPGQKRLVGCDQSHAWVSVYCGDTLGWMDVDPTNNCFCNLDHIPVAIGRDYQDVVPLRGVFLGGGQHTLTVNVDVEPMNGAASATKSKRS